MKEETTYTPEEMHKALFVNLIMMLATSAMQALGKLANPATNKIETNLEMAQHSIDMLEMLAAKTRNNLDKEEVRLVKDTLSTLQLNFVETTAAAPKTAPAAETAPETPPAASPEKDASRPAPDVPKTPASDPKYRKSYG